MRIIISLCALALVAVPAAAQAEWTIIGQVEIARGSRAGTIRVPSGQARFSEIKFCAEGGRVLLEDAVIRQHGGVPQDVRIFTRIEAGRCTRGTLILDMSRLIEAVEVRYHRASSPARIQMFGR